VFEYLLICFFLSVESPNDEFQLVRDFVDVTNFHNLKTFDEEKFKKLHYQEMVKEFKNLYKVNQVIRTIDLYNFIYYTQVCMLFIYIKF